MAWRTGDQEEIDKAEQHLLAAHEAIQRILEELAV
jgi:hypothetical protein